jgi:hypothetical protein
MIKKLKNIDFYFQEKTIFLCSFKSKSPIFYLVRVVFFF